MRKRHHRHTVHIGRTAEQRRIAIEVIIPLEVRGVMASEITRRFNKLENFTLPI